MINNLWEEKLNLASTPRYCPHTKHRLYSTYKRLFNNHEKSLPFSNKRVIYVTPITHIMSQLSLFISFPKNCLPVLLRLKKKGPR